MQLALTLATFFAYAHAGAVELTADNFESSVGHSAPRASPLAALPHCE
jgi:hypothetical protein